MTTPATPPTSIADVLSVPLATVCDLYMLAARACDGCQEYLDAFDRAEPECIGDVLRDLGWEPVAQHGEYLVDDIIVALRWDHRTARGTRSRHPDGIVPAVIAPTLRLADYRVRVAELCETVALRHGNLSAADMLVPILVRSERLRVRSRTIAQR